MNRPLPKKVSRHKETSNTKVTYFSEFFSSAFLYRKIILFGKKYFVYLKLLSQTI